MPFKIPKHDLLGMMDIKNLSDEAVEELIKALQDSTYNRDMDKLSNEISKYISLIPDNQLSGILQTLDILYHVKEFSGVKLDVFLDDIMQGLEESSYIEPPLKEKELLPL